MAECVLSNITTFSSYFGNQQIFKNKVIAILAEPVAICCQITLELIIYFIVILCMFLA
jgi:hypothetical protein